MNIHLKRILCLVLAVCLLFTMTGCNSTGNFLETMWHMTRTVIHLLGFGPIIASMWVVDLVTWPFVEQTGFNVNDLGNRICQKWTEITLPELLEEDGSWGGWFVIRDEEALEAKLRAGGHLTDDTSIVGGVGKVYSNGNPGSGDSDENKCVIHYDATGGDGAPEDQVVYNAVEDFHFSSIGTWFDSLTDTIIVPKISDQIPTRSGYHFVGWTASYNPEDNGLWEFDENGIPQYPIPGNMIDYLPGDKITSETGERITQDTTLYAVWQKHAYEWKSDEHRYYAKLDTYHKLEIKRENKGKTIRIFCTECGFELIDRDISPEDFVKIWRGDNEKALTEKQKIKCNKEYILYRTQDFAPLALSLIGSFYNNIGEEMEIDQSSLSAYEKAEAAKNCRNDALDLFGDFGAALEFGADFDLKYANSQYSKDFVETTWSQYEHYDGYTVAYFLREQKPEDTNALLRQSKVEFFKNAENIGKGMDFAFTFAQAVFYGYDAFTSNEMASSKTVSLVKSIHALVNLCPYVGDYYDKLFVILEEGLELYDDCVKEKNSYYTFLEKIIGDDGQPIPGTKLTMRHIDQARNGFFSGNAPSIISLLESLLSYSAGAVQNTYSSLTLEEKTLVVWYISMRLEYDFETEYGITLKDYIGYFNGNKDKEKEILKELKDIM